MPFSHHSHSGEFCMHASNSLEEMILTAIELGFRSYALTEHMPRDQPEDLYPEEIAAQKTPFDLYRTFASYHATATQLSAVYSPRISLPIAFEIDYIRPSSLELVASLRKQYRFDYIIGSVHHVHTIPIDFDLATYQKAVHLCGGSEEKLFEDYFDAQYEMLIELKPAIVGHFDLIRLFSGWNKGKGLKTCGDSVWGKAVRNLQTVVSYGGLLELNSAALRKMWTTPYPGWDVAEVFRDLGGRFCLSDDAHRIDQVGLNYHKVLEYVKLLGIDKLYYLERLPTGETGADFLDGCAVRSITVEDLEKERFWKLMRERDEARAVVA